MIIDLSKRGFLPKGLENEPIIVDSIMDEKSKKMGLASASDS